MKKFFTLRRFVVCCLFLLSANVGFAQVNEWTWMKGASTPNAQGIYGIKGVAAAANFPGAREFSATCTDSQGNLWLFGGTGNGHSGMGELNDLWKYNVSTGEWTWVNGDSSVDAVKHSGLLTINSPLNNPGAREQCTLWADKQGFLWLFGGIKIYQNNYPLYNDLWKYDITYNEWTWMKGDSAANSAGSYGYQGLPDYSNSPGARKGCYNWMNAAGDLWVFGGYSNGGIYNDLWKYNPPSNQWTWMKGNATSISTNGVAPVKGVADLTNTPGSRQLGCTWADNAGNLWLFGGQGTTINNTTGNMNDLWKYNINANAWTWVSGDSATEVPGTYGIKNISSATTKPGARFASTGWIDATDNLWVFGGTGLATNNNGFLNDLWKYDHVTDQWTWMGGDSLVSQYGVYYIRGVSSLINKPGGRAYSFGWVDSMHNFWLSSGLGSSEQSFGSLNDLWRYVPSVTLPVHLLNFTARLHSSSLSFGQGWGEVALNWTVENEQSFDRYEIERRYNGSEFNKIGSEAAINARAYSYTDNNPTITPNTKPQTIYYRLKMIDRDGKFTYSKIEKISYNIQTITFNIFPNPATDKLQLQVESDQKTTLQLQVLSQDGKIVMTTSATVQQGVSLQSINISKLQAGHYFLKVLQADHEPVVLNFEKAR